MMVIKNMMVNGKTLQGDIRELEALVVANYQLIDSLEKLLSPILFPELTSGVSLESVKQAQPEYEAGLSIERLKASLEETNDKIASIKSRLALEQTNIEATLTTTANETGFSFYPTGKFVVNK